MNLLVDLFHYGCMLRGQIQQLYFGSVQRANMRLRQLFDEGYVKKATLPLPTCMGIPFGCQTAYMLGAQGIPIVAARTGMDAAEVRRQQRHGTPAYLLHTVEIVQFRLALEEAVHVDPNVQLEQFLPERLCFHRYQYREREAQQEEASTGWRTETYKPDAVFLLSEPAGKFGFAVEIDLGHTSSAEFVAKLNIHVRYAQSGLFLRRYGVEKARTLVITTSGQRRDNLLALAQQQESVRFWFSTFAEVAGEGMLGAIWHAPFASQLLRLQPQYLEPTDITLNTTGGEATRSR